MATSESAPKKRGRKAKAVVAFAPHGRAGGKKVASTSDALIGFEEKLWQMADKLRNDMDAAEYKHVRDIAPGAAS
jgi:hypothetical protein